MNGLRIFLVLLLCQVQFIQNFQKSEEEPVELTTLRQKVPLQSPVPQTVGRTRNTVLSDTLLAQLTFSKPIAKNYCCFWINPRHPALPDVWKHCKEYPFDFVYNGEFIKNMRNE